MNRFSILFIFLVSCSDKDPRLTEPFARRLVLSEYSNMQDVSIKVLNFRNCSENCVNIRYEISYTDRGPNPTSNEVRAEAQVENLDGKWRVSHAKALAQTITFLEDRFVEVAY